MLLVDIEKKLGPFRLRASFTAGAETLALLGASGSGKSVTLQCIAGIITPDRGRIEADGVTLFDSRRRVNLPPQARRVGLLFQNYALFPHMTVRQNIRAGGSRERDRGRRAAGTEELLERFGLAPLADRYPAQLSGGEQQRTALARILLSRPRVLLLDEPFSALDAHLRLRMEREVGEVLRELGKTAVLVTHDREEAYRMADSVAVMNGGTVEIRGEKRAVFADPRTRTAALLTGCENLSRLERQDDFHACALDWGVSLALSRPLGDARYLGIRMRDIRPADLVQPDGGNPVADGNPIAVGNPVADGNPVAGGNPVADNNAAQGGNGLENRENTFPCRVVDVTENPFTCTVLLRPAGTGTAGSPLAWEVDRETWSGLRSDTVEIFLPPPSILLLRE